MRSIRVNVPESEYSSFLEFLKKLPGTSVIDDAENDIEVSEAEKNVMRNRVKNAKPEDFTSWDEIKKTLKVD